MNLPDLPFDRELLPCLEHARLVRKVHLINGLDPQSLIKIFEGEAVGSAITADGKRS
jgi:acetylglutamate kinase